MPLLLLFRLDARTQYRGTLTDEDLYYTPAPSALPLLSLGYRRAAAALMWVQALQYFGEQVGHGGQLRFLLQRADAVLALDPTFREVYVWIAIAIVYNSTSITRQDIETSNRYLERGIRQFPRDGELKYMLAFNYAIELPSWSDDAEQKRRWRRRAAELFAESAGLPGAPQDAALMAVEMGKRGGDRALAIAYTRRLLARESDDSVRDRLVERLSMLTSREEADQADADRQRLLSAWRRDWPYLPAALFALVGERLSTAALESDVDPGDGSLEREPEGDGGVADGTGDGADAGAR